MADDRQGNAERRLVHLHARHLGDVELPFQLARASEALAAGRQNLARDAVARAIGAARTALAADPREALWHARLAVALALQPGTKDDGALRELDAALSLAPRTPEIRQLAAEVLWLRGDTEGARAQLAAALRLRPSDRATQRVLDRLNRRSARRDLAEP